MRCRGILLLLVIAFVVPTASATNRLKNATSRYLLQHAGDPVAWYPWGDEALQAAAEQKLPIFLSIGYSTCHWCHVMAQESFADPVVAERLNGSFIAIKVDREERPDLDSMYMTAARQLISDPGWPLNLVLTPEGVPFFAATYLPRERLLAVLGALGETWSRDRGQIEATAAMVAASLTTPPPQPAAIDAAILDSAFEQLASRFDSEHGGFLAAPKLPAGHQLMFLLRYWQRSGNRQALAMVTRSLDGMREGALWDAVDSGFHRYSSDAAWTAPHYEKMLYDQAVLAMTYLEAWQATGSPRYEETARGIFRYVLTQLRSPGGAFYSSQDADEHFYVTSPRNPKKRPGLDRKIIADWNGLMIAALAYGASALDEPAYAEAATKAARLVLRTLRDDSGNLLHQKGQRGFLDDSAFVTWGLLNLYEATFDAAWLREAIALQDQALRLFRDEAGRFYLTETAAGLLLRPREVADSSIPSGNSVQLMNLLRLARITGKKTYQEAAATLLRQTLEEASLAPSTSSHLMSGLHFFLGPSFEVVLSGPQSEAMRRATFGPFVPNKVVLARDRGIMRLAPFTEVQEPIDGKPTAYVCRGGVCRLPTIDPAQVRKTLTVPAGDR